MLRRRRMVQVIPGFPIYARGRSGYSPKADSQNETSENSVKTPIVCLLAILAIPLTTLIPAIVIVSNERARERADIILFDKMNPSAQQAILQKSAIELNCVTGYTIYRDDNGNWHKTEITKKFHYDSLKDFLANRANLSCYAVTAVSILTEKQTYLLGLPKKPSTPQP